MLPATQQKILVFQHVAHETPGVFSAVARDRHAQLETLGLWTGQRVPSRSALDAYDRLLVMGGPQSAYGPAERYPARDGELDAIRYFVENGKPVLGVCLGSQLIAAAFGASVHKGFKETGFHSVGLTPAGGSHALFTGLPSTMDVFQWHGDEFDLLKGASLLASGQAAYHQAFSYKTAAGILFHPEMTPEMIQELLRADSEWFNRDNMGADEAAIMHYARIHARRLRKQGEALFDNWLGM